MRKVPLRWAILLALGLTTAAGAVSTDEIMRQAQAGDIVAQREWGQALLLGRGVPQDVAAGLEWLDQAASRNDPYAAFLLAKHYEEQPSSPGNHNAMVRYYRKAAAAGHTTAQARLGEMLLERSTDPSLGESDRDRARSQGEALLSFAANANNGYAALALAVIRTEGRYGLPVNTQAGLALYEKAARSGQTAAAVYLAERILRDPAAPADLQREGIAFLVQAANDGVPSAMADLAKRFADGRGVPQDPLQAEQWAQRAQRAGVDVSGVLAAVDALRAARAPSAPRSPEPRKDQDVLAVVPKRLEVANPPPGLKDRDPDADKDVGPDPAAEPLTLAAEHTAPKAELHSAEWVLPSVTLKAEVTVSPLPAIADIQIDKPHFVRPIDVNETIESEAVLAVAAITPPPTIAPAHAAAVVAIAPTHHSNAETPPSAHAPATDAATSQLVAQLNARLEALEHEVQALEGQRHELERQLADRDATLSKLRTERDRELVAADQAEAKVDAVRQSLEQLGINTASKSAPPAAAAVVTVEQAEKWNEEAVTFIRSGNYASALPLLRQAGDAGNGYALNNLGMMHVKGLGVPANTQTAIAYFERAVAAGHGGAANNLGYLWLNGVGVVADRAAAVRWYERGAKLGDARCARALEKLTTPATDMVAQIPTSGRQG